MQHSPIIMHHAGMHYFDYCNLPFFLFLFLHHILYLLKSSSYQTRTTPSITKKRLHGNTCWTSSPGFSSCTPWLMAHHQYNQILPPQRSDPLQIKLLAPLLELYLKASIHGAHSYYLFLHIFHYHASFRLPFVLIHFQVQQLRACHHVPPSSHIFGFYPF